MQPKGLSTLWTRNLPEDEKKDFEVIVRNSVRLLTRLKQILQEREREVYNSSIGAAGFKDPNWSHKRAYDDGKLSTLKELQDLIPF